MKKLITWDDIIIVWALAAILFSRIYTPEGSKHYMVNRLITLFITAYFVSSFISRYLSSRRK